nr:DNRLRE domain-containing protein [uncultured Desulfobacter sp.]
MKQKKQFTVDMYRWLILTSLLLSSVFFQPAATVNAATYTVFPTDDTYVEELSPYNVKGALGYMQLGGYTNLTYSYLKFNFDFLDQDEIVTAVTLSISGSWTGSTTSDISLYLVNDDSWDEQTLSWSNQPASEINADNLIGTYSYSYFSPFVASEWNLLSNMQWASLFEGQDDTQLTLLLAGSSFFFFSSEGFLPPYITIVTEPAGDNVSGTQTPVPLPSSFWLICVPCLAYGVNRIYRNDFSKQL